MKKRFIPLVIGLILLLSAVLVSADGKLVIYNAGPPEMGEDLVRAFKAKHRDIDVEIIRIGSGEIITRVKAEARRPQGDIIMAMAKENMDIVFAGLEESSRADSGRIVDVRPHEGGADPAGFLMPSFVDGHCHFTSMGLKKLRTDTSDLNGKTAILDLIERKCSSGAAGDSGILRLHSFDNQANSRNTAGTNSMQNTEWAAMYTRKPSPVLALIMSFMNPQGPWNAR